MKIATKFASNINTTNLIPELIQRLHDISQIKHWTSNHSQEIDLIDSKFTSILLESESKCAVPTDTHWSSKLQTKFITYSYWKISIRGIKSNKPVSVQLQQIKDQISSYDIYQGAPTRTVIKQLQHARKALIDACNNSYQNQQHFLDHIQWKKIDAGQTTQAAVIKQIQQAERRKYCWNTFMLLRKGPQMSGGLTHILVPEDNSNPTKHIRIQNKNQLDSS
jgi:hypothetical protein